MKVTLYRNKCIACGYCISISPDLWMISFLDGKITAKDNPNCKEETQTFEIDSLIVDQIEQSAKICPVSAIKILIR